MSIMYDARSFGVPYLAQGGAKLCNSLNRLNSSVAALSAMTSSKIGRLADRHPAWLAAFLRLSALIAFARRTTSATTFPSAASHFSATTCSSTDRRIGHDSAA